MAELSPAQLRQATDEVAELIQDRLPLQMPPNDMWPTVAHGFLARGGTLLESVTLQTEAGMPGEAQMLLRILFEHVATFCWLGSIPSLTSSSGQNGPTTAATRSISTQRRDLESNR